MPTGEEPVKLTMSTSFESPGAAPPSGPEPHTRFTTPGGNPTSRRIFVISKIASGSCGAGFITTVFPIASAGAIFPARLVSGKLYGGVPATTPTGWGAD